MAEKRVVVKVTSEGLKETTAEAQKLNKELTKVEKTRKVSTTGSRAADAALLSSGKPVSTGLGRGTAASMSRGDNRDFARQAQGLGGLVHVYATFAANIFAVAAAFNALSKAADFELMVKSAETLSTRVGMNISNTAKHIQVLTDGAVSLKDAFQSAALASTAGLNTKQIEGLTKAAKGASLAMGRDMTDSLNRVFRGTIKIEPELLDELGIMVKVNDVNREYAKSVNKSVTALTDFERRQAFVNGVLEQAKTKYGELADSQVNAFSKLQASTFTMLTSIGNMANTILGPIASVLASSPTALLAAIGAVVGLLVKQAIPAIKDMQAAQLANLGAATSSFEHEKKLLEDKMALRQLDLRDALHAEKTKAKAVIEAAASNLPKGSKIGGAILALTDAEKSQVSGEIAKIDKKLNAVITGAKTRLESLKRIRDSVAAGGTEKYGRETFTDTAKVDEAITKQLKHAEALENTKKGFEGLAKATDEYHKKAELTKAGDAQYAANQKALEKATDKYLATRHRMNAVIMSENSSFIGSFKNLFSEITKEVTEGGRTFEKGTGKFLSIGQKAAGAFSILTSGAARLLSVFSVWGAVLSIATVAIIGFLKGIGQLTDKSQKVSEAAEAAQDSYKSLADTYDKLGRSTTAADMFTYTASALSLQAESVTKLIDAYRELQTLQTKGTPTEKFLETAKDFIPFIDSSREEVLNTLEAAYNSSDNKKAIEKAIQDSFPADIKGNKFKPGMLSADKAFDFARSSGRTDQLEALFKAINNIDAEKARKASEAMNNIKISMKSVSDNAKDYINSLSKANKEYEAANNILSSGISVFDSLSSGNVDAFAQSITGMISSISEASTIAYTQTQGQFDSLLEYNKLITDKQKEIASLPVGVEKDTKQKELASLISKKSTDTLSDFVKYIETASKKLYELGGAAGTAALKTAAINRDERLKDFYNSIIGAQTGSEKFKADDKLIDIQQSQLRVQLRMLEVMHESEKLQLANNASYKIVMERYASFNNGKTPTTEELAGELTNRIKEYNSIGEAKASPVLMQTIQNLAETLSVIEKLKASELSNAASKREQVVALKVLGSQKSTEGQRNTADKASITNLTKDMDTLDLSYYKLVKANELLERYTNSTALGLGDFDKNLETLRQSFIDNKADLEQTRKDLVATKDLKDFAVFNKLEDISKYSAEAQYYDIQELEKLKLEIRAVDEKLRVVNVGKAAQEFSMRLAEYKSAESMLSTLTQDLVTGLNEQILFDLNSMDGLDRATANTVTAGILIQNQLDEAVSSLKVEERLYNIRGTQILSEEQQLERINIMARARVEYQNKITEGITRYIEMVKLLRNEESKQAENTTGGGTEYLNAVFSNKNMRNAATEFITTLRDGVKDLKPWVLQLAEGLANSINSTIDMAMDLFQKAELTWKSFSDGFRNILSDMFKNLASDQFKKASAKMFEGLVKRIPGMEGIRSDQEQANDMRDKLLGDNTTQLTLLREEMSKLAISLSNKALNAGDALVKKYPDNVTNLPNLPPSAETFPLPKDEPLKPQILGEQANPWASSSMQTFTEDLNLSHPKLLDLKESSTEAAITIKELNDIIDLELIQTIKRLNDQFNNSIIIDQKDLSSPTKGSIEPTSGSQDISLLLEADAQIEKNNSLLKENSSAKEEETDKVSSSSLLLQKFNEELATTTRKQEEIVSSFDRLQTALDSLISKIYKVPEPAKAPEPEQPKSVTLAPVVDISKKEKSIAGIEYFKEQNSKPAGMFEDAANTIDNAASVQASSASTAAEASAQDSLSSSTFFNSVKDFFNVGNLFQFAVDKLLGGLGGSGGEFNLLDAVVGSGIKALTGGLSGLFSGIESTSYTPFSGTASQGAANFSTMDFNSISAFSGQFADGGVMTQYGPMKLQKYAAGGIANSPQAAVFGEGSMNEAFVPLPNGKAIPVEMNGGGTTFGDTNVSIQVNVSSDGKQDSKVQSDAGSKFSKQLAAAVKNTIQEELVKQQKPGGILYNR